MSTIIVHYDSLEDASRQAEKASKKLEDYAEKLQKKVSRKISDYSGETTGNISSAQDFVDKKIKQLNNKAEAFLNYSRDVDAFTEAARAADKKVASDIEKLSGEFKLSYGIKNNVVTDFFNYFSNKLNESALGRFLKDCATIVGNAIDKLTASISDWYKYEGGKYIIDGIFAGISIALGVCAVIAAFVMGGPLIVMLAGVVSGCIAVLDGFADLRNSAKAYQNELGGDPAWAKRYGDLNTFTDTLRKESNSLFIHNFANTIDVVGFAADAISFFYNIKDLGENFMAVMGEHGGFKNYITKQYDTFMNSGAILKNALFGSDFAKIEAREAIKLFKDSKIAGFKDTVKLYSNPGNWLKTPVERRGMDGYALGLDDFVRISVSEDVTFFGHVLSQGGRRLDGIYGLLYGTDRTIENFAVTVNNLKDAIKPFKDLGLGGLGSFVGESHLVMGVDGLELKEFSIADFTSAIGDAKDLADSFKNIKENISSLNNIKENLQMRKILAGFAQ